MPKYSAGAAVVEALRAEGVGHIFGVVGSAYLDFLDAMYELEDIRFVGCRHEQGAGRSIPETRNMTAPRCVAIRSTFTTESEGTSWSGMRIRFPGYRHWSRPCRTELSSHTIHTHEVEGTCQPLADIARLNRAEIVDNLRLTLNEANPTIESG